PAAREEGRSGDQDLIMCAIPPTRKRPPRRERRQKPHVSGNFPARPEWHCGCVDLPPVTLTQRCESGIYLTGGRMPESRKAAVVRTLHGLQERLTAAHLAGTTAADDALVRDYNALLVQAKEQFPRSDTLRLIEPLGADASAPVLAVRLVMMRRTLDSEMEDRPADEHRGAERRRWERRDVAWAARFLVGEGSAFAARAVDASRHGLRLVLEGSAPVGLANGQKCCVEVHLAGSSARFVRDAEVC